MNSTQNPNGQEGVTAEKILTNDGTIDGEDIARKDLNDMPSKKPKKKTKKPTYKRIKRPGGGVTYTRRKKPLKSTRKKRKR